MLPLNGLLVFLVASLGALVVVLPVLLMLFIWRRHWNQKHREDQLQFPYPPYIPARRHWLLGHGIHYPNVKQGPALDAVLLEWANEHKLKYYSIESPVTGRLVVCADPNLVHHIAVTKNFGKSFAYKFIAPLLGEKSMIMMEKQDWMEARRAFHPGFHPNHLKHTASVMAKKMDRFVAAVNKDISNKVCSNTLQLAQAFTADVIVTVAFGEHWDHGGADNDKTHAALRHLQELQFLSVSMVMNPLQLLFGVEFKYRIWRNRKALDRIMNGVLGRRLAELQEKQQQPKSLQNENECDNDSSQQNNDICSLAIQQWQQPDGSLSSEDRTIITHQLRTFFAAGYETTGSTIAWCCWLLSQHPDAMKKLRTELERHRLWRNYSNPSSNDPVSETSTPPTYEALQACSYLEAVLLETLRLYPPARTARYTPDLDETWTDPNTGETFSIGGINLHVSPYVLHRHEDLWERPNDFLPERFWSKDDTRSSNNQIGMSSKMFMSFLRGPRDCLGKYFALLEMKIAISRLVLEFDFFECSQEEEMVVSRIVLLPKHGARVRFRKRLVDS